MKLHPNHERFLSKHVNVPVSHLLHLLDGIADYKMRDEVLFSSYLDVIQPRMRRAVSVHETQSDLMEDAIGYAQFKRSLLNLTEQGFPNHIEVPQGWWTRS